jgi:hypothetical protein
MKILNLTMHKATKEQIEAGVFDLHGEGIVNLLTFEEIPTPDELEERATQLAKIAQKQKVRKAMIGGAPYLMPYLENQLCLNGIAPVYAFSKRESVEKELDGKVIKTNVFKHVGFVETVVNSHLF